MILKMFSVKDKSVGAYLTPFFARSTGEAIRSFSEAVNTAGHQMNKYSSDFELYCVGEFDDSDASFMLPADIGRVISADAVLQDRSVS